MGAPANLHEGFRQVRELPTFRHAQPQIVIFRGGKRRPVTLDRAEYLGPKHLGDVTERNILQFEQPLPDLLVTRRKRPR